MEEKKLEEQVASLEAASEHPLKEAFLEYIKENNISMVHLLMERIKLIFVLIII